MLKKFKFSLCLIICLFSFQLLAAERNYELRVQQITKNITGVAVPHALAINGSIPAPTLRFNLGDQAIIKVINETDEPTTLHWHGLLVPWRQDGPQFANTRIIEPNTSHTFKFPIKHTGTYWYHSHTELQEQRGLYGAIVIEEDTPKYHVDHDYVLIMSDWTNEKPAQVLANLKKDGHYYKYKKDFFSSISGAIRHGAIWNYLKKEWNRMEPMDLSDVGYDAFLINGKIKSMLDNIKHGEKIRFRIINASASTYFYFNIGNLKNFTVVSKDGVDTQPVKVNELLIGIAETYDIIFKMPHHTKIFEARATAQDITGSASLMFGQGEIEHVPNKIKPSNYSMDHGHNDNHIEMKKDVQHQMEDELAMQEEENDHHKMPMPMHKTKRLNYRMLKSITPTEFDKNLIRAQVIELELSGDMERYTWYINGKPFSEDKYIDIRENEIITFKFINKTMMHHPMHLHGHFFRALMGQGKFAPLFHTVDVAPMKTVTIEFHANQPGIWFLHCHNLYHMKMGMARLVKYNGIERASELIKDEKKWGPKMTHDNDPFVKVNSDIYSNIAKLKLGINAGRYQVDMELEIEEYDIDDLQVETIFKRYIDRFLSVGMGIIYDDQKIYTALAIAYNFPGKIEMEGYIRHDGKAVIKLTKVLPITAKLSLDLIPKFSYKDDFKWSFKPEFSYHYNENFSFGFIYQRDEEGQKSVGFGMKIRF